MITKAAFAYMGNFIGGAVDMNKYSEKGTKYDLRGTNEGLQKVDLQNTIVPCKSEIVHC